MTVLNQLLRAPLPSPDASPARGVRVRAVALPVEHGGWGFSLEPVALGLLVAPSLPGLFLAVATLAAFLARHPLKLVMADRRRGRRFPRTRVAGRFALLYAMIASLSLLAAIKTAASYELLLPLVLAAPLALIQLAYDRLSRSRALLAELAGATAMASVAASIALALGLPRALSFGLWAILAARFATAILYVRARLKTMHGGRASTACVIIADALALSAAVALAWAGVVPVLAVVALSLLLLRALYGFSGRDGAVTAKQVGIREFIFGAMTVLAVALGHHFNL